MNEQKLPEQPKTADKSRFTTWILGWLFGGLGLDRFYLGQIWTGVLKFLTMGGLGIWTMIDLLYTAFGNRKDKKGRLLEGTDKERKLLKIITAILLITQILLLAYFIVYSIPAFWRNILRTTDIRSMEASLKLYQTDVSAELPSTTEALADTKDVKFCGASCQTGSTVANLKYYKPKHIKVKEYEAGLKVPDAETVVIMANATCEGPKINSMAILSATERIDFYHDIEQQCITVAHQEFNNINGAPNCGLKITEDMPLTTRQFIAANIERNRSKQLVTKEMESYGSRPGATPTAVDLQLAGDKQFLADLDKIKFPPPVEADMAKLKAATLNYDNLITQLREYLWNGSLVPTSLSQALTVANADQQAAYLIVRNDLKLSEPTCTFLGP